MRAKHVSPQNLEDIREDISRAVEYAREILANPTDISAIQSTRGAFVAGWLIELANRVYEEK